MRGFTAVFVAVVLGSALVVAALLLHGARPETDVDRSTPEAVVATGRCASCHRDETAAMVAAYEESEHARAGTTCLDCHQPVEGQESYSHRGFDITSRVTAANCAECHATQYRQFLRSRHAAPAFAAVRGAEPFTPEQVEFAEQFHPGAVRRPPNVLAALEGEPAIAAGCETCHAVGRPNPDGSIGTCTQCHSRHRSSLELARLPRTCGQCHMGPDHSQLEIYEESKHGVLFDARRHEMNLGADPVELTAEDMPIPTCATCHMSGLGTAGSTHDVTARLSYFLFAPVSERRDTYLQGRAEMMGVCNECHTDDHTAAFFQQAEAVLGSTNEKVQEATRIMEGLREDGLLTPEPFDEPIEFHFFDYWHYYGRTAKHGAFMGGADFVQWHGNYELLLMLVELKDQAEELRSRAGRGGSAAAGGGEGGGGGAGGAGRP